MRGRSIANSFKLAPGAGAGASGYMGIVERPNQILPRTIKHARRATLIAIDTMRFPGSVVRIGGV